MTREVLEQYISEEYGADGEHLWAKYPDYEVFRHAGNRKWFAVLMNVPEDKLLPAKAGRATPRMIEILDVKCEPFLTGSLSAESGFFPAYHMNRGNWISMDIELVGDEKVKSFLEMSFGLTAPKTKTGRKQGAGTQGKGGGSQ